MSVVLLPGWNELTCAALIAAGAAMAGVDHLR